MVLHAGPPRVSRRSLIGRIMVMHIVLAVRLHALPLLLFPLQALLVLLGRFRGTSEVGRYEELLFLVLLLGVFRQFWGYCPGFAVGRERGYPMQQSEAEGL